MDSGSVSAPSYTWERRMEVLEREKAKQESRVFRLQGHTSPVWFLSKAFLEKSEAPFTEKLQKGSHPC